MILPINKVKHQQQPCDLSCYVACVAMLTGKNVEYLLHIMDNNGVDLPTGDHEGMALCVNMNIMPVKVTTPMDILSPPDRFFIGSVVTKNENSHAVLFYFDSDTQLFSVFDPQFEEVRYIGMSEYHRKYSFYSIEIMYDCDGYIAT